MIVQIIFFQRILLNDYEFGANPKSTYANLVQLRSIALALASHVYKIVNYDRQSLTKDEY